METFLIKALQLILSLSILVIVHEFGHFLFARIFKIKVEKFYLFFDPWFSLFKFKPKGSDTEYGIGWLPLGGYVKIAGMIDESMDKEQLAQPEQPWEFRSKPAWQRLLVMVGGVTFNVILAIFIYSMIVFCWGDKYVYFKDLKYGMSFSQAAKNAGFQDGDKVVSADGKLLKLRMDKTLDMNTYMAFADAELIEVVRGGQEVTINLPEHFADSLIASRKVAYQPRTTAVVDSIVPGGNAEKSGLQKGDSIVQVNGKTIGSFNELRTLISENKNKNIALGYYRGDSLMSTKAYVDSTTTLGFFAATFDKSIFKEDKYSFFGALPAGIKLAKETLEGYIGQFRFVFTKEGASNLGGFAAIGNLFPAEWDWQGFWFMTAFLSVILAVMNILPIPALDGGHVMFLLYEVVTRRKPNEKFVEYATMAGMGLLVLLLLYANGNDIFKAIFK